VVKEVQIDGGADLSVFPESLAGQIGISDLSALVEKRFKTASGGELRARIAQVRLRLFDHQDPHQWIEWEAEIALAQLHSRWYGLAGRRGFLEFLEMHEEELGFWMQPKSFFPGHASIAAP
jgi:hypothetical protein